jgi:hypothetical protein
VQLLDAALLLLLLIAAAVYTMRGRVRKDPWLAMLQTIRDKASMLGIQIPEHATPREIARALPNVTAKMTKYLMELEAARYGSQKMDIATLKRQLKNL